MLFPRTPHLWFGLSLACFCLALHPGWRSGAESEEPQPATRAPVSIPEGATDLVISCGPPPAGLPVLSVPPPPPPPPPPPAPDDFAAGCVKVAERMPLFPGCAARDYADRKTCADRKLLDFVYENLRWPEAAREAAVEGMAVVSFVVEKDGRIGAARIMRDPGAGTGAEARRVVELMRERGLRWEPGMLHGEPVCVRFNLPVKFKLE